MDATRSATAGAAETVTTTGARTGRPSYVWCFAAFLVANMFAGKTGALPLPVGPDRLLLAAAVLLFLLDPRVSVRQVRWRAVHVVALAVLGVAVLSAVAAQTLTTSLGFFALLDRLAVPYLVFAFAPIAFHRAEDRLLLLRVLTLMGIYLGVTAVGEMVGPHAIVLPRYILDPTVGIQYGRARGPFAASEANGLTLVATLWCAVVLARSTTSPAWRRTAWLAVALTSTGALLTLTRSVWLGLVLGVVLVAVLDRGLRRRIVAGAAVVAVAAATVFLVSADLREKATGRASDSSSVYDRRNTNAAALRAIAEHPVTGIGWVRFIDESGRYVRQDRDYPVTVTTIEVHNVVLSRAAELGIPGGALWVASVLLGPGLAILRRSRTDAEHVWRVVLLGSASAWGVSVLSSPLPYPLPNTLLWLFAGLASAGVITRPRPRASTS